MHIINDNLVFDIQIQQLATHKDATIIELFASIGEDDVTATGCARRHPEDKYSEQIGIELAFARALDSLSAKLKRRANGKVKHAENEACARQRKLEQLAQVNLYSALDCYDPSCTLCNPVKTVSGFEDYDDNWSTYSGGAFAEETTPLGRILNKDTAIYKPKPKRTARQYFEDEPWG